MIESPLARAALLAPAKLYEYGVRTRIALYEMGYLDKVKLRAPIISVGNLSVGGTGKTPLVAFLARYLQSEGHQVAVLSRGYRRQSRGRVEVSTEDSVLATPGEAGDEPALLAAACPGVRVVVDRDRAAAGAWLEGRVPVSVFLLDDGFQHLRLARDLNIVLVDATDPVGGERMLPFGRLREPLTSLRRADAIIVTRSDQPFDQVAVKRLISAYCIADTPVFYGYHDVVGVHLAGSTETIGRLSLSRRRVAVFSGIARPERFDSDLEHLGMQIVARRRFSDHHRYDLNDLQPLLKEATRAGAEAIVTTEKDEVNLPHDFSSTSNLPVYVARIEFRCEEEATLKSLVLRSIMKGDRRDKSGRAGTAS